MRRCSGCALRGGRRLLIEMDDTAAPARLGTTLERDYCLTRMLFSLHPRNWLIRWACDLYILYQKKYSNCLQPAGNNTSEVPKCSLITLQFERNPPSWTGCFKDFFLQKLLVSCCKLQFSSESVLGRWSANRKSPPKLLPAASLITLSHRTPHVPIVHRFQAILRNYFYALPVIPGPRSNKVYLKGHRFKRF